MSKVIRTDCIWDPTTQENWDLRHTGQGGMLSRTRGPPEAVWRFLQKSISKSFWWCPTLSWSCVSQGLYTKQKPVWAKRGNVNVISSANSKCFIRSFYEVEPKIVNTGNFAHFQKVFFFFWENGRMKTLFRNCYGKHCWVAALDWNAYLWVVMLLKLLQTPNSILTKYHKDPPPRV